jgi:hypothetical protein
MIDLGNLPGGTGEVRVTAINSLGQVLGLATGNRAFLWTPSAPNGTSGTMVEVQSLLSPTDSAHWNVLVARGINDRGQIAGTGLFDPDGPGSQTAITMAFLLNPVPEPGTFALIVPIAWSARRIARHKCAA